MAAKRTSTGKSASRTAKATSKTGAAAKTGAKAKSGSTSKTKAAAKPKAAPKAKDAGSTKSESKSKKTAKSSKAIKSSKASSGGASAKKPSSRATGKPAAPAAGGDSSVGLLARAEADITTLLESLNSQMTTAMNAITELAVSQRGPHEAVIRTRPIDRATAMFQRLIGEVLDDKLDEMLPTLVALRNEMRQRADAAAQADDGNGAAWACDQEFLERGGNMLDQVLASAEVRSHEPQVGDPFDPLIHLAVGESSRDDLADDVVADVLQPGFRTGRGKVIVAARVKVNRR